MAVETKKASPIKYVHYAVVLFLCFIFPILSPLGALSPQGMALIGAFIGAVYGWTMIDMLWPSFAGLLSMIWFLGANQVASMAFGNTTVIMLMFSFIIMGCLTDTGAVNWLINKLLSLKFFLGKPWVTIGFFFFVAYLIAGFNSVIMSLILIPIIRQLFKTIGVEPYTKLPALFLIGVMYCILMGQVTFPFLGVSFTLLAAYSAMFQTSMNFAAYLSFTLPLSIVMILIYIAVMRFIFRVDVTPFKNVTQEVLGQCPPLTKDQRNAFIIAIIFFASLILSSLHMLGPIYALLNKLTVFGIATAVLFVTLKMKMANGKPITNPDVATPWNIVLITALVMVVSSCMNNPEFGIRETISMIIKPMMGLSPYVFIVSLLTICVVLTHFATNMVLCIIMMPFMVTFATSVGMNPTGAVALLFFSCQMSLATPGGGAPVSAIFYDVTDYIKVGQMGKYAVIAIIFLFLGDVILGLTWASIIF